MLLRGPAAWRAALQGFGGPGWRAASSAAPKDPAGATGAATDGESVLAYWKQLLDDRAGAPGLPLGDEDVRQLLHTALRLRQGKGQSSVPEQLLSLFVAHYRRLERPQLLPLFRSLVSAFGVQAREVDAAAAAWQQLRASQQDGAARSSSCGAGAAAAAAALEQEQLLKAAAQLSAAASPLYARLFVPLSQQPGGIQFLAGMRADLLQAIRDHPSGAAPLRALSEALRRSLAEWFSVGLLQLRRISWQSSSAALLEKVAAGEAVHELSGWGDLKARLDARNRRVYAFFHTALPQEPLVVLHTALMPGVARSMQEILPQHGRGRATGGGGWGPPRVPAAPERTWAEGETPPAQLPGGWAGHASAAEGAGSQAPRVAVFYSISSTQPGLAGVDLGNFLIKQVAQEVQAEFPSVETLCTLSPMPGFADWLRLQLARVGQGVPPAVPLLLPDEAERLELVAAGHVAPPPLADLQREEVWEGRQEDAQQRQQEDAQQQQQHRPSRPGGLQDQQRGAAALGWALTDDAWLHSSRLEAAVRPALMRLAARYLLRERRRGLALDPVANFHLRNGAAVLQLNWRADLSAAGLRRSHGVMVNYVYELDRLQDNNRAYLVDGRVAAGPAAEALLGRADQSWQRYGGRLWCTLAAASTGFCHNCGSSGGPAT